MRTHAIRPSRNLVDAAPSVRRIEIAEPLDWLRQAIQTFVRAPGHSLLYGALFSLACWATIALIWSLPWFALAFLTGLMLLGPFLAAGLYVAARQQESGQSVSIRESLGLIWRRRTSLGLFALFLGLIAAAWVRLSALLFAIQFDLMSPSVESYLNLFSSSFDPVVAAFFVGIGLLLAFTVFATSAVAIPMILDRDVDPITAINTSLRTFALNWPGMLLWAASIVALSGIGILTGFIGMILLFPLLGYATWHSYRRMVA
ncbi:DUF2189 domain-containing protein [Imhoffiella purpurea]|uniref:Conserved hypothetical membrane protein n=1 Tax=Imhoffiella purpurea TaxID=1249627 RepID=W9V720_9GAMM|nr:DUF2189 domain-containing protein [Imhoffiella purpurea]EXJ15343.1 conserved hypothetical membrane protein [Imhoffiella purpurea]